MQDIDLQAWLEQAMNLTAQYGMSVLGALIILIIGFWAAGFFKRLTQKALDKSGRIDKTITIFMAGVVRYAILILTIVAVLDRFGVETTSLVALLGAAGLAVGLAMQGTLSNIAAGVMLLFFRPFRVGDFVDAGGISGTVDSINLFTTDMNTADNVHIVVPNSKIWGQAITNYSHNETRRLDIPVGISYSSDIDRALEVARKVVTADERVLDEPAPVFATGELADSSVNLIIRGWTRTGDFWQAKWDLTKAIKEAFDREGIDIPFPHRTVQLYNMDKKQA